MDLTDDNLTTNNNVCPCCSFDVFLPPSKGEGYDDDIARQIDRVVVDRDGLPQSVETVAEQLASARRGGDSDGTEKGTTHRTVMVVDTHGHPQLNRDRDETYAIRDGTAGANLPYLSLACAVGPDDFVPTLEYAATSSTVLPAIGCHPWYVDQLDVSNDGWLDRLERLLVRHPSSIVGEIGLCKIAKWVRTYPHGKAAAMDVQRRVFKQQMELAAKLRRPVTVHCFDAHGMFMSVMKELVDASALPPAIGMHSFTGTAHHVKELLDLERSIPFLENRPLFYFGFSHAVNYAMCTSDKSRRKGREAVKAVPMDRLMVESDVHHPRDVLGGTIGAIAYTSWAREVSPVDVADWSARNGLEFLGRSRDTKVC